MSNIHGFGAGNRNAGGGGGDGGGSGANSNTLPILGMGGSGNDINENPREENFCKFLKNFCCPMFLFTSVIFFVSCADYVFCIYWVWNRKKSNAVTSP
jgi:hypothetical protein